MADYDDDWMHPQNSRRRSLGDADKAKKEDPRPYIIEREAAVICSFVGGRRPTKWKFWSSHRTHEERDAALAKLRKEHPAWHLRPAVERDRFGRRETTVEDEESDLLARLMMLRSRKSKSRAAEK